MLNSWFAYLKTQAKHVQQIIFKSARTCLLTMLALMVEHFMHTHAFPSTNSVIIIQKRSLSLHTGNYAINDLNWVTFDIKLVLNTGVIWLLTECKTNQSEWTDDTNVNWSLCTGYSSAVGVVCFVKRLTFSGFSYKLCAAALVGLMYATDVKFAS